MKLRPSHTLTPILLLITSLFSPMLPAADTAMRPLSEEELCILNGPHYSAAYQQCVHEADKGLTTYDRCLDDEFIRQDQRLNQAYRATMQRIQPARRPALRNFQRLWIRYRDQKCRLNYYPGSGSGGLMDMRDCRIRETIRRAIELENFD